MPTVPCFANVQLRVVVVPVTNVHCKVLPVGQAWDISYLVKNSAESRAYTKREREKGGLTLSRHNLVASEQNTVPIQNSNGDDQTRMEHI